MRGLTKILRLDLALAETDSRKYNTKYPKPFLKIILGKQSFYLRTIQKISHFVIHDMIVT